MNTYSNTITQPDLLIQIRTKSFYKGNILQVVCILAFLIGSRFSIVAINELVFDIKAHEMYLAYYQLGFLCMGTKNPINVSSDYTQVYSHLKYHKKYTLNRKDSTWHEVGWTKCWEQYLLITTNKKRQVYDFPRNQNKYFSKYL